MSKSKNQSKDNDKNIDYCYFKISSWVNEEYYSSSIKTPFFILKDIVTIGEELYDVVNFFPFSIALSILSEIIISIKATDSINRENEKKINFHINSTKLIYFSSEFMVKCGLVSIALNLLREGLHPYVISSNSFYLFFFFNFHYL
jgi:hypothetical protein